MKKKNVSIKEISELSGVSIATVSRVINQTGRFSKATEQKVLKVIEENNYHPNLLARGLRTNKVQTVGIVVPDISNEYFSRVSLALQLQLFQQNYAAIICNTNEVLDIENKNIDMLKSQQVSGLIYISGSFSQAEKSAVKLPVVYIDRHPNHCVDHPYVLIESDNMQGGYLAAQELIQKGCKNIVAITFNDSVSSHSSRIAGYKKALSDYGLQCGEDAVLYVEHVTIHDAYKACKALLKQDTPVVDGLFCTADLLAYGVLNALDEENIAVPQRIKVVGFDDLSTSMLQRVSLTTVRQSIGEFGRLGVETLVRMIEGDLPETNRYVLPVELIQRSTT